MQISFQTSKPPPGWVADQIGNRIKLNYGKSQARVRAVYGQIPIYGTSGLMEYGNAQLYDTPQKLDRCLRW